MFNLLPKSIRHLDRPVFNKIFTQDAFQSFSYVLDGIRTLGRLEMHLAYILIDLSLLIPFSLREGKKKEKDKKKRKDVNDKKISRKLHYSCLINHQ